MNNELNKI